MRSDRSSCQAADGPQSLLDCLRYFLTPAFWRQAHRVLPAAHTIRWHPQPLLFVLLAMTWCSGDSCAERFETAKAFYIASYQRQRRPGKTVEGFHKALARVPAAALRRLADAVRARLHQVFASRFMVDGFVPFGCDGTRLSCPRSRELEQRLPTSRKRKRNLAPSVTVTAFVHLSLGLLWSWRVGGPRGSEKNHLTQMLSTLPRLALIVADAGYMSFPLMQKLIAANRHFLIRLSSIAPLYATERVALHRFREGLAYYWPTHVQRNKKEKPIAVRLLRLRSRGRKGDVWLMTNVLDGAQLPLETAGKFYRWRWRNEGLFRTYKRTLGKVKLVSRTVAQIHRELEGSLLAVQLLLAQGALALPATNLDRLPSGRQVLLEIRAEIRNTVGMYLGPRQRRTYMQRLRQAKVDRRRRRKNQIRRRFPTRADHKPPKAPKILKMGTILKDLLAKLLDAA